MQRKNRNESPVKLRQKAVRMRQLGMINASDKVMRQAIELEKLQRGR